MGAGPQLLQKVGTLIVKAALNSVPLAGLALDLGQMGIDFANARVTERFFEQLGERIDRLEEDARERLKQDQVHQTTADAAIRRLLTETNPRMADALARAVAELGKPHRSAMERMEVARALSVLTEPNLHLLQTFYRGRLPHPAFTEAENKLIEGVLADSHWVGFIVRESMPAISWVGPVKSLEAAGLIELEGEEDFARSASGPDFPMVRRVLPLGEIVVRLCFADPNTPTFGKYAPERV